jgi:hypothetical protein
MKTIFKYELSLNRTELQLPKNAKVLTAQLQEGVFCIWVMLDQGFVTYVPWFFDVYGTGHNMPSDPGDYVATAQMGPFVWHVFDATRLVVGEIA